MSRVELGDFEITLIRAGDYWWDGGALFGVVPKTLWQKKFEPDQSNRIRLGFNCYVIRTGNHSILVETGAGGKLEAKTRHRMKIPDGAPSLPELLSAHHVDPERIDIVINSHLHFDHCGGNTVLANGAARPAFPRARYYTQKGEWEHAHTHHIRDSVSYIHANYDPLVESGRMQLLAGDCEVVPGIAMKLAPGHNRDMSVVTATSAGQTFCFFSDLIPTAAHVTPSWIAAFDLFPLEAIDNKIRWMSEAARGRWLCGFGHDPEVAFARIEKTGPSFSAVSCA
ncbi:MAG TPA: MBL fold metallo-hydrolase [Bryobacteraceae bacterium]|nr:MBL fold metallo-hydrolase [Bryobacteraceae bacterium]